jgi:hypothetical protein
LPLRGVATRARHPDEPFLFFEAVFFLELFELPGRLEPRGPFGREWRRPLTARGS